MSATILKTGFSLAIIIAVIALLQTSAALDAVLLFAAAGVVPGTDIRLTPMATIWTLVGIAALSILLIFSSNIVRAIRSWRTVRRVRAEAQHMIDNAEVPAPLPVAAAPVLAPAPVAPAKVAKPKKSQPVVVIKLPGRPGLISRGVRALRIAFVHGVLFVADQSPVVWRELTSRSRYAIGVCGLYLAYGWRRLKPRLIAAYKYLDARLNRHQDITFVFDFLRSASKVLGKWWTEGRTYAVAMWRKFSRKIA